MYDILTKDEFKKYYTEKIRKTYYYNDTVLEFLLIYDTYYVYYEHNLNEKLSINYVDKLIKDFKNKNRKDKLKYILDVL